MSHRKIGASRTLLTTFSLVSGILFVPLDQIKLIWESLSGLSSRGLWATSQSILTPIQAHCSRLCPLWKMFPCHSLLKPLSSVLEPAVPLFTLYFHWMEIIVHSPHLSDGKIATYWFVIFCTGCFTVLSYLFIHLFLAYTFPSYYDFMSIFI